MKKTKQIGPYDFGGACCLAAYVALKRFTLLTDDSFEDGAGK
jgi:hypothetical protein